MNERNSIEIDKTNLTDQTEYRLSEITKVGNYFIKKINQRKTCSKKLSKYAFDYIKFQLFLVQQMVECLSLLLQVLLELPQEQQVQILFNFFSLTTGIIKKLLSITRNKKKKHDKILMLAKSKLNGIQILVSQVLIDMEEISHEEFNIIIKEKKNTRR